MENNKVIPQLRFPGFKGDWEKKKFKDITFPAGKKNSQNLPYERYSISNEVGFYPQSDQFEDGGGYLKDIDCRQYIVVPPKSFAYNPARINVGSIGYQDLGKEVIVSSLYEVFRTSDACYDPFLWQWFHTDVFHRMVVNVQEGGVRQYFFYEKLKECSIYLPSISEQKKIADCLAVEDDLISAQKRKVEALRSHKQGLMQLLFPQPGETTPRLRFPGFSGEWKEKKMSEVFSRITRKNAENNLNVLTISAQYGLISQLEFFKKSVAASDVTGYFLLKKGEFAYNKSSSQGRPFGAIKPLRLYDKGVVSTLYICFKCNDSREIDFWDQYFDAGLLDKELMSIAQEGARNHGLLNIPTSGFFNLSVLTPSIDEQQKIAFCLSSLDNTIQAESDKLDALKAHKKGLMQQLFPQPTK
ncbi:MAG: restriction endonuclease subunit S [Bacteroidales bacterium]|nr:restriction endonuclease subunit S [Bacteroidales bacterium]